MTANRLTRRLTKEGPRWADQMGLLPPAYTLERFLGMKHSEMHRVLDELPREPAPQTSPVLSPAESSQEVWAAGVTYLRSRNERQAESIVADVYGKVYEADRPELFFKALGWRTCGSESKIRVRRDSVWNVPEPELTLVINQFGEIVGFTAGNDVSSRSIEGENPLYLPQAKSYDGSCALGPSVVFADESELTDLIIECRVERAGSTVFSGSANTSQMKRSFSELASYLFRETSFPAGVFLMTGTGIVPEPTFTLQGGDRVTVKVGELSLTNEVAHPS